MKSNLPPTHGIRFSETAFFVRHRRREFGPFDFQWGEDLRSLELTYQGARYGEIWSLDQMHLDLREFRLPRRVVQVALLVVGSQLQGLLQRASAGERRALLLDALERFGCAHFMPGVEPADA